MKNLIIICAMSIAGYYAYQYYRASPSQESTTSQAEAVSYEYLTEVPGECQKKGDNVKNAIYGYDIGRVSMGQLNFAIRSFQSCLRDAGFSDLQINETVDAVKEDVMSLNPGNSKGY